MKNVLPSLEDRIAHAKFIVKIRHALLGTLKPDTMNGPRPIGDGRDYLVSGPNPFYNQTNSGFQIEHYYGMPNKLWTPWGYVSLWGSGVGHFETLHEKQMALLGATVSADKYVNEQGEYGPWWNITKVFGETLPTFKHRDRLDYVEYDDVKQDWKQTVEAADLNEWFKV